MYLYTLPETFNGSNVWCKAAEKCSYCSNRCDQHWEKSMMKCSGHQRLQLVTGSTVHWWLEQELWLSLWPHSWQYKCVISTNTHRYHQSQDVHEGEEVEPEDEGVGEVGQCHGVPNGGDGGNGDGETGGEAPHTEEDHQKTNQEIHCIFYQIGIEQSILQT